jgi:hypothetical protein
MDEHIPMGYGGHWNEVELELYETGCLLEVGVVEKGWITTAMRIS